MQLSEIKPHLTTTNVYVQQSIIRTNIARLNELINHKDFNRLIYQHRKTYLDARKKQRNYLKAVTKRIKQMEQTSFSFGGFSSFR